MAAQSDSLHPRRRQRKYPNPPPRRQERRAPPFKRPLPRTASEITHFDSKLLRDLACPVFQDDHLVFSGVWVRIRAILQCFWTSFSGTMLCHEKMGEVVPLHQCIVIYRSRCRKVISLHNLGTVYVRINVGFCLPAVPVVCTRLSINQSDGW